jgi:hypothetical protein
MGSELVDLIADVSMNRPHLVILGAGASLQAFPRGDKNGRALPVMNNLVETVGLGDELESAGVDWKGKNFEDLYSSIVGDLRYRDLRDHLETGIYKYFATLELPETPTLYDHLVLSLRPKDIVATFNWDPFLADACARNAWQSPPPKVLFLHGNVRVGTCPNHKTAGYVNWACASCGSLFEPTRLLYPIADKNYSEEGFISAQWHNLRIALKRAYVLTIFGYGAPRTDGAAIELMMKAWNVARREHEQTELIDIKSKTELAQTWSSFIHTHHYEVHSSFYDSYLARYPRRTCEAMWRQFEKIHFLENNWIPREARFSELIEWFDRLILVEPKESGHS